MSLRRLVAVLLLAFTWVSVTPDVAHADPPKHRLFYKNRLFARYNPLGLINVLQFGYRHRMYDGDGVIFEDNYVMVGPDIWASPAFLRGGVRLDLQPIRLLRLFASYQHAYHFGTFDQVASFDDPDDRWSDNALSQLGNAGQTYPTNGHIVYWGLNFVFKLGPVAVQNNLLFQWQDYALNDGDSYYYDQIWDHLLEDNGIFVINDFDVLGLFFDDKFKVGARYTYTDAFLRAPGTAGDQPHHRLGPILAYQFHDRGPGARFDQPQLFFAAQWWLQAPWRAGQEQSQALPVLILGVSFQGDWWTKE